MTQATLNEQIAALEQEIEQLRRQFPAHSIPPSMLQRLDDLEDELKRLLDERNRRQK
jgi:uncharacterized small protein (DUF1192 family)